MLNDRGFPTLGYGCAGVTVALAIVIRLLLGPLLGAGCPFATLFFAIPVTVWFGGFGPALAAVFLGGFASDYFLLAPRGSFSLEGMDQRVGLVPYAFTGIGIAVLRGSMRAARERAEASASAARRMASVGRRAIPPQFSRQNPRFGARQ